MHYPSCKSLTFVLIIILIPFSATNGVTDIIFGEPVRIFNKVLTQNPIVRIISDLSGDAVAVGGGILTEIPLAISRVIGIKGQYPKLLDNIASSFEQNFLQLFNAGQHNEDVDLNITELITKYGYRVEQHTVQTKDGYILSLFRIPPEEESGNKAAVFLMHGLLSSSDDWIISGPENCLAYMLANEGYDVWLGNARGNKHSKRHASLSPSDSEFWNFSWDEIGRYDLPAMIDHILAVTTRKSLKYVGHSQGTTTFFVMCSELPEYNDKIDIMFALSPVAWMTNVVSPVVRLMASGGEFINALLTTIGVNEFLPHNTIIKAVGSLVCADSSLAQIICSNVVFLTCGFSLEQLNATLLPVILGHSPSGSSVKQVAHYGQGVISRDFRKFDYGNEENLEAYKVDVPPSYAVNKITAPVSLFYSRKDWLASPEDVDQLYQILNNVVDLYEIPRAQFNHIDFIWGIEAKELVFDRVLQMMKQY